MASVAYLSPNLAATPVSAARGGVRALLTAHPDLQSPFMQSGFTLDQQHTLATMLIQASDFESAARDLSRVTGTFGRNSGRAFGVCETVCAWYLPVDGQRKKTEYPMDAFDTLSRSQWTRIDRLVRRGPEMPAMHRRQYLAYALRGDPFCEKNDDHVQYRLLRWRLPSLFRPILATAEAELITEITDAEQACLLRAEMAALMAGGYAESIAALGAEYFERFGPMFAAQPFDNKSWEAFVVWGDRTRGGAGSGVAYQHVKSQLPPRYRRQLEACEQRGCTGITALQSERLERIRDAYIAGTRMTNIGLAAWCIAGRDDAPAGTEGQRLLDQYRLFKESLPAARSAEIAVWEKTIVIDETIQRTRLERAQQAVAEGRRMTNEKWYAWVLFGDIAMEADAPSLHRPYANFARWISDVDRTLLAQSMRSVVRPPDRGPKLSRQQRERLERAEIAQTERRQMSASEWWAYILRGDPTAQQSEDCQRYGTWRARLAAPQQKILDTARSVVEITTTRKRWGDYTFT